jgi:phage terminase large subunit
VSKNKTYKIVEGGLHDRFHQSRAKVQFIGGGYGNGKTTACCIKALKLCMDYPGSNGLIARATYPKLNDTIKKEFFKWCPASWIKRMPTRDDNTCVLKNNTTVNFRYVAQRGKETEESKSNLLSATYDWMIVDQMEDPEFSHKDFMDLMGRLRGDTEYVGEDKTMPKYGPRWFMITSNPTRNWVFRELVRPLQNFGNGKYDARLLCEVDKEGQPVIVDGRPVPLIELYEGSTYENVDNVGDDYIQGMLSAYTGSMRRRFIFGEWGALSGLVYPQFDEAIHVIQHDQLHTYMQQMRLAGYRPNLLEAYDHGIAAPSCYMFGFVDDDANVFVVDGFYAAEMQVASAAEAIQAIRDSYGIREEELTTIYADPNIFRRSGEGGKGIGTTVARMFAEHGISMQRGANDIYGGIAKFQQYLTPVLTHEHPIHGMPNAPFFYISDKCSWFVNEITEYYWRRGTNDEVTDMPMDRNDHAMDTVKYLLTPQPRLAKFVGRADEPPSWMKWHEIEHTERNKVLPRYR